VIYLRNTTRKHRFAPRAIARAARALLAAVGEPDASLSLSFVGDAAIRRLNREHRGKDRATDVLSFSLYEPVVRKGGPGRYKGTPALRVCAPPTRKARGAPRLRPSELPGSGAQRAPERMLGDIVIGVDTAVRQARAYDATLRAEVERLLIHGLLHLLGHDHETPRERARMVREERRLAAAVGLPWPYDDPQVRGIAAGRGGRGCTRER
jgi:probable rRNA maturation factor